MLSMEPDVGSIPQPWDHDLSGNQESETQPNESPRRPYLQINLTKEVKDPYTENYKIFMKQIEDNTNKRKYVQCS